MTKALSVRVAALLVAAAAAAAATGCVSIGRPFPTYKVTSIVVGKTTQHDLVATYGQPYRTGVQDGDATWTYVDYRLSLLGEQQTSDLYVRFNADGTVKSYAFNTNATPPDAGTGANAPSAH